MASWNDCLNDIEATVGRPLSEDEKIGIVSDIQNRMKAKMNDGMNARDAARAVGKDVTTEAALRKSLADRDAYNNILRHSDLMARVIPGQEVKVEFGTLQGRNDASGRGFSDGADNRHHALKAALLGPLVRDLDKVPGLLKIVSGGRTGVRDLAFERDVANELGRLDDPSTKFGRDTKNPLAKQAAEIFARTLETSRAMMNNAGAFIGRLDNYMGRQYHDMLKIRQAGLQAWMDDIKPRLDMEKMFAGADQEAIDRSLTHTYNALASGMHDTTSGEALGAFKGPANLGKKASEGRSIIFKTADDWHDYNEKFGKGGVMDGIVSGADAAARDTALMQIYGTNPEAMFNRVHTDMMEAAKSRGDMTAVDALRRDPNQGLFETVTGKGMVAGGSTAGTIGAMARNASQLIHLGTVAFSATSHFAIAPAVLRHNGIGFFQGVGEVVRGLVPEGAAAKEIRQSLGAGIDGTVAHIINRFRAPDGVAGAMARSVNVFHKLNGFTWLLDGIRSGTGMALSHNLASYAGKGFADLDSRFQSTLRRYGIESAEWDHGRATVQKVADGRSYMLPADMADKAIGAKFQTYITDQIREALNDHTPWANRMASLGTQSGTPAGEVVRAMMQFKGFALTMMERQLGREMRRNGFDLPGVLYMIGGMTLMGYAGNTMRDFAANRSPRHPTDAQGWLGVVTDALTRGGAFGLYADALLQDHSSTGGDVLHSMMGPMGGTAADTIAALNNVRMGSPRENRGQIALKEAQKILGSQVPNVAFTKSIYDYLVPYSLQNMAHPGAVQRAQKLMKAQGQHFVLSP